MRILHVEFLPGVDGERVRSETFGLFERGLHSLPEPPHVRPDFFGSETEEALYQLRHCLSQILPEP